jgi:glycosyltransferase involved in cell wall biosynthesis
LKKISYVILTSSIPSLGSVESVALGLSAAYKYLFADNIVSLIDLNLIDDVSLTKIFTDIGQVDELRVIGIHPQVYRSEKKIRIILSTGTTVHRWYIHLFGDFQRQASYIFQCIEALKDYPVGFICPSNAFLSLVSAFIPKEFLFKASFPLPDLFQKKMPLTNKSNEILNLVYAGRINEQKNLDIVIDFANELAKSIPTKLTVIGDFFVNDFPVIGELPLVGKTYQQIKSLENDIVHFQPACSHEKLLEIYSNAHFFISLSTYHDEDFGLAPIEALVCGSKLILTRWGGYKDIIENFPKSTIPVEVALLGERLELDFGNDFMVKLPELAFNQAAPEIDGDVLFESTCKQLAEIQSLRLYRLTEPSYNLTALALKGVSYYYDKTGNLRLERYKAVYEGFGLL